MMMRLVRVPDGNHRQIVLPVRDSGLPLAGTVMTGIGSWKAYVGLGRLNCRAMRLAYGY